MKTFLILLAILICSVLKAQEKQIGKDLYFYTEQKNGNENNCGVDIQFDPLIHVNLTTPLDGSVTEYIWPFDEVLDDGVVIVNYVDDLSGSTIKDYNDNDWSYNGHNGTDIALHDFRNMDRFYKVKAAAAGTVVQLSINNFDRNTGWGTGSPANLVLIHHDDGTYAYYYHFMKNSIAVKLGEYVTEGQLIGYVGSSGNSTDAHLHFEPGSFVNGSWVKRDPWQGTYNHSASLWQSQYSYVGFREFILHDMGVYTAGLVGGNMANSGDYFKERILTPHTISGYESKIGFWMLVQGNYTGKQVRFEIRRSDGSLFDDTYFYFSDQTQYGTYWWTPNFNPGISVTGDWYVRVLYDNVEKGRYFFNVQLLTSNRPRMYPVAAKCFRRSLFVQKDTIRVRPVRSGMEYQLIGAPSNVTLTNDSIITIGAFTQSFRIDEFKVIGSLGGSTTLRDTMIYKLIDTTKNNFTGNGIVSLELNAKMEGRWSGSSMVGDTVTVFLRRATSPYNIADFDEIKLNSSGYAIANFFYADPANDYYIVLKHRNSIETWSKTAQNFPNGQHLSYDFTTSRTKAYGDNLKLKSGEYCLYTGDSNQDGVIDGEDISDVENYSELGFQWIYSPTDLNGDEITDADDISIVENNTYSLVLVARP